MNDLDRYQELGTGINDVPDPVIEGALMIRHTLRGQMTSREVWLDDMILLPLRSQEIVNHSPDGFCWGYGGSGPSQLALAILLELLSKEDAFYHYQDFKQRLIAKLQGDFHIGFYLVDILDVPESEVRWLAL